MKTPLVNRIKHEWEQAVKSVQERKMKKNKLGKDQFLQLLVTELKFQDPTRPMKDKEFIAQLAQFSSLEQMKNISKGVDRLSAMVLLGKHVKVVMKDSRTVAGIVNGSAVKGGKMLMKIGDVEVSIDEIKNIAVYENKNKISGKNK